MRRVTKRQIEALRRVAECIGARGRPPTQRELATSMGDASVYGTHQKLQALARHGLLTIERGRSRAMALTPLGKLIASGATGTVVQPTRCVCGAVRFSKACPVCGFGGRIEAP